MLVKEWLAMRRAGLTRDGRTNHSSVVSTRAFVPTVWLP
jgi:hypothetical protein